MFKEVLTGEVSTIPENALIVEGRFAMIDPGSRAKRYWGGFGAGKSGDDTKDVGEDIAKFLGAWATGKDLTKD